MAQVSALFQPLHTTDSHCDALLSLLAADASHYHLSTAFARHQGIAPLASSISSRRDKTRVFVGVRNGSTTAQGLISLLRTGASVYGVDTGFAGAIFHPKFYAAVFAQSAQVIIGSANLTFAGTNNNIEASALLTLDLGNDGDKDFLDKLVSGLDSLESNFPLNCYRIRSVRQIVSLMNEGVLEDERVAREETGPQPGRKAASKASIVPRIGLGFKSPPRRSGSPKTRNPLAAVTATVGAPVASPIGLLVWEKPNLPQGDLQLLTQGHVSGVLRLTQARFQVAGRTIDQTTYFRQTIFGSQTWTPDSADPGKETANAEFDLIIGSVFVGTFDLKLSHKPAWEAGQGNYTTGLHWGDAGPYIRRQELVGRTLRLYRPSAAGMPFAIEID